MKATGNSHTLLGKFGKNTKTRAINRQMVKVNNVKLF